ncbi:MAG: helix-turn-helix domain-containing protein [Actinomycetota bacterium]
MNDARTHFLDELCGLAASIARESTEEIARDIDGYRRAGPPIWTGVEAVVTRTYLKLVQLWRESRRASAEEIDRLATIGIPPPETGITLEETLQAYRIAAEVFWRSFGSLALLHRRLDRRFPLEAVPVGIQYLNDLSTALTHSMLEAEKQRGERLGDAERALIDALIASPPRLEEASRISRILDVPMAGTWQALLAKPREQDSHPLDALADLVSRMRRIFAAAGPVLVAPTEGRVLVVLDARGVADNLQGPVPGALVGIGRPHAGPLGVGASYSEAREALAMAIRQTRESVRFEDVWLERFLLGSASAEELAEEVLGPLRNLTPAKRGVCEETLEALLDNNGSVAEAARCLYLHEQTVRYRLRWIRGLLGSSLDSPDKRLAVHLALKRVRLAGS